MLKIQLKCHGALIIVVRVPFVILFSTTHMVFFVLLNVNTFFCHRFTQKRDHEYGGTQNGLCDAVLFTWRFLSNIISIFRCISQMFLQGAVFI